MSQPQKTFHFALRPVQEFVSQARRVRDYWAGSFALSWLAAVAMREVAQHGGRVVFPAPPERFLRALEGRLEGDPPQQGVVPNRFKAIVPADFDPLQVCAAVRRAWIGLAGLVWERLPAGMRNENEALREVWSRQIGVDLRDAQPIGERDPYWQMDWALGDLDSGEDLLDRRHAIVIDNSPAEPGAKCMLMDGWQELSGSEPLHAAAIDAFWAELRSGINQRNQSDLREGEQLCAISLVKRIFPHWFERLRVSLPSGWTLHGWRLGTGVPSAAYLAAAPWLRRVVEWVDEDVARSFYSHANALGKDGERSTNLCSLRAAARQRSHAVAKLADLDGALFFESSLADRGEYPDQALAAEVRKALGRLAETEWLTPLGEAAKIGHPDPYFAVLAMDGDELGRSLANPTLQEPIAAALEAFADRVVDLVEKHSGFLVYSGGDDVVALLTVPEAIPCARALHQAYDEAFRGSGVGTTLSGAICFANHKLPLRHVFGETHRLLKRVAKDDCGRDALVIQVTSRGGELIRWVQPWAIAQPPGGSLVIEDLAAIMAGDRAPFSHKFFHRIDDLLRLINPNPGLDTGPLGDDIAVDLFTAELLDSGLYRRDPDTTGAADPTPSTRVERARRYVRRLLDQCRPRVRARLEDGTVELRPADHLEASAAFLVRFLERRQWSTSP